MPKFKRDVRTASPEAYKIFCKKYPEVKITSKEYMEIIKTFHENLYLHMLETGEEYTLPYAFGTLVVSKKKLTMKVDENGNRVPVRHVDWGMSNKIGKRVYHLNGHSDGFSFRWMWLRPKFKPGLIFPGIWEFKPFRVLSRTLAQYIKNKEGNYQELYREVTKMRNLL